MIQRAVVFPVYQDSSLDARIILNYFRITDNACSVRENVFIDYEASVVTLSIQDNMSIQSLEVLIKVACVFVLIGLGRAQCIYERLRQCYVLKKLK